MLRRGIVADDSDNNPWVDKQSKDQSEYSQSSDVESIRQYNRIVLEEPRLDAWLMPLFDGVNMARLID